MGLVRYVVFFVIDIESRRVEIAGITRAPHEAWMKQIARYLTDAEDGFLLSGEVDAVNRVLDAWNVARQRDPQTEDVTHPPLVYAIRDLLEDRRLSGWAVKILKKMGYKLAWRDGKYKVLKTP